MQKENLGLLETSMRHLTAIGTEDFSILLDAEGKSLGDLLQTYRQLGLPDTVLISGKEMPIEFFKDFDKPVESLKFEYEIVDAYEGNMPISTAFKQHRLHIGFKDQPEDQRDTVLGCVTSYFGDKFQEEIIGDLRSGNFGKYRQLLDVAKNLFENRRLVDVLKYEVGMTISIKDRIYLNSKISRFRLVDVEGKLKLFVKFSANDKERYITLNPKTLDRDPLRRMLTKQSKQPMSKIGNVLNTPMEVINYRLTKLMDRFLFDPLEKSSLAQRIIDFSNRKNNQQSLNFAQASPSLEPQLSRPINPIWSRSVEQEITTQRPLGIGERVEAVRTAPSVERIEFVRSSPPKPVTPNIEKASQILFPNSISLDAQKNILKQHNQQLSTVLNAPGEKICLNIQPSIAQHIDQNAVRFSRPYLITNDRNHIISNKADIGAIKDAFGKENKGQLFAKQMKELPKAKALTLSR